MKAALIKTVNEKSFAPGLLIVFLSDDMTITSYRELPYTFSTKETPDQFGRDLTEFVTPHMITHGIEGYDVVIEKCKAAGIL